LHGNEVRRVLLEVL